MKECIALNIAPEKKDYVHSNAIVLATAYSRFGMRGRVMECRAVYAMGEIVGLASYNYYDVSEYNRYVGDPDFKEVCYRIHPFMIDKAHLEKGYEEAALRLLLDELQAKPFGDAAAIFATHFPKEEDVAGIYASVGFSKTDATWAKPNDKRIFMRMGL